MFRNLITVSFLLVTLFAQPMRADQELLLCQTSLARPVPVLTSTSGLHTRLVQRAFQNVAIRSQPSPGVSDPLIETARALELNNDFKFLSDLRPRDLSVRQKNQIFSSAAKITDQKSRVQTLLTGLFESGPELLDAPTDLTQPMWRWQSGTAAQQSTLNYIENLWSQLVKRTPPSSKGSLIPVPFPILIPGARFQESYYWDSYFGILSLVRIGRWELAAMQVENFLFMIESYGLVPNGLRDYYLTRSQPPLLASMVRVVVEEGLRQGRSRDDILAWLRGRALPLLKKDYFQFWMNPKTRYDAETGLNHHWDALNTPREERSVFDDEKKIAKTYRDVRAEAESGRDFTGAFAGEATRVLPVLLNSILYKAETDVAWLAELSGDEEASAQFSAAAARRRQAMSKYLWDAKAKTFKNYHLDHGPIPVISADIFSALWAGVATTVQAAGVQLQLASLEHAGGIAGSSVTSGKQWDAPYGWAPDQYFAIAGLRDYGFADDAKRIAIKWTDVIDRIHQQTGVILEKVDVVRAAAPVEANDKYETQQGFLWTNAVWIWIQTDVLGAQLTKIPVVSKRVATGG